MRSFLLCIVASWMLVSANNANSQSSSDQIRSMVRDSNIETIDVLLSKLDESFLENFTLIYESNSLQHASPQAPRVLMFSPDASLLLAFSGYEQGEGFDTLEMIDFARNEREFNFSSIRFPKDVGESGDVEFSENNPKQCMTCHREQLRPNWDGYPVWFGVYGSIHHGEGSVIDERAELRRFIEGPSRSGRYRYLKGLKTYEEDPSGINLDLTRKLADLNYERVFELASSTPEFDKFKYAVLGATKNCDMKGFLPESVRRKFQGSLAEYYSDSVSIESDINKKQVNAGSSGGTFFRPSHIGSLRFLFEGRGIPIHNWSMPFGDLNYNFSTGRQGIVDFAGVLSSKLGIKGSCGTLREMSLAAFE